jgi:hypothetical protein
MTRIEKYLKRFETYSNGGLSPGDKEAFEKTLAHDKDMQLAWKEYRAMMDAFSDKEAISLRLKLEEAYYNKTRNHKIRHVSQNVWFRISAAAVLIIIMGCLLYFYCSSGPKLNELAGDPEVMATDSIVLVEKAAPDSLLSDTGHIPEKQLASIFDQEAYQISPMFAELLHNVYRSGWFHLTAPTDSVMFSRGDSLLFVWETNIEAPLYFDVLDRHGRVVYKYTDAISSPWTYIPTLPPAIYMFRFATQEEPVWMGVMVEGE